MGVEAAVIGAALIGAATAAYNEDRSRKAQHQAQDKQEEAAKKQLDSEEEAQNRANRNEANIEGLLDLPDSTGALGSGTSLTGADGVQTDSSLLGKGSTLSKSTTLGS